VQTVLQRLRDDAYPGRFAAAFPQATPEARISWDHVIKAVSAFERSLITVNSKYDQAQGRATLSAAEQRRLRVFREAECVKCHQAPNFGNQFLHGQPGRGAEFLQQGALQPRRAWRLPGGQPRPDRDHRPRGRHGAPRPTLRNIEVTAPYMHDGSVATLKR
jgi:cytochrome c peroxidase